ncbi:MAG: hypothetical protein ABI602_00315 [Candidatus Saccharibacteria bacterium]
MEKNLSRINMGAHTAPGSSSGEASIPPANLIPLQVDVEPHYAGDRDHNLGATAEAAKEDDLGNLDRLTPEELVKAGARALVAMSAAASYHPPEVFTQEVPPSDLLG